MTLHQFAKGDSEHCQLMNSFMILGKLARKSDGGSERVQRQEKCPRSFTCCDTSISFPESSFPLTSGRKARALGATISGMRHRCRLRSETGWAEFGYFLRYFKWLLQSSRFPTAGQGERRLWERDWWHLSLNNTWFKSMSYWLMRYNFQLLYTDRKLSFTICQKVRIVVSNRSNLYILDIHAGRFAIQISAEADVQ